MKRKIVASIIAKNQDELNKRISKVSRNCKVFQLDIMDGNFVKNKSLDFYFDLPKKYYYEAHLMVKEPMIFARSIYKKVDSIIFHIEACRSKNQVESIIKFLKTKNKKIGIAINPRTKVEALFPYLKKINLVIVMTVTPGTYGGKFLPDNLGKIKLLKVLNPRLQIEVDGGINDSTILKSAFAGANRFVVGSYLQNAKDLRKAIKKLEKT